MKIDTELLHNIGMYVSEELKQRIPSAYSYHNLFHTLNVVKNAEYIASEIKLDKSDKEILLIAAWFHDVGYIEGAEKHEKRSIASATRYLKEKDVDDDKIKSVTDCIRATEYPQQPFSLTAKILCDADMLHIAERTYLEKLELLKKESENLGNKPPSETEWLESNINFLVNYTFFTPYCRENFEKGKIRNIEQIKARLEHLNSAGNSSEIQLTEEARPDKSAETMIRTLARNHMELSAMADNKANILITINTLVISIIISVLVTKLEKNPQFIIPTVILILFCITTIVITVFSTRPKIPSGKFTDEEVRLRKTNLLFFGNFHNMPLEKYQSAMKDLMQDKDYLYSSMTKDIHSLGKVLAKKYHHLGTAYNIFMFGLIISLIAFAVGAYVGNYFVH